MSIQVEIEERVIVQYGDWGSLGDSLRCRLSEAWFCEGLDSPSGRKFRPLMDVRPRVCLRGFETDEQCMMVSGNTSDIALTLTEDGFTWLEAWMVLTTLEAKGLCTNKPCGKTFFPRYWERGVDQTESQ